MSTLDDEDEHQFGDHLRDDDRLDLDWLLTGMTIDELLDGLDMAIREQS